MSDFAPTSTDSTPIGTVPASPEAVNQPTDQNQPQVIDIDPEAMIRVKGSDKPVKFSEYGKSFQAQATRAQQERARIERELAQSREQLQRYEQEKLRQTQTQQPGQKTDPFAELAALPYLSGQDAVKVVQSISAQIQQRDQVLYALATTLKQIQDSVGGLNQTHAQGQFEAKIGKFLKDGGFGEELRNLATETYLAYEPGPDLDAEFPHILAQRVKELREYIAAEQRRQVEQARRQPFIPGKGGNGQPSKPLAMRPSASAMDVANELWDSMQVGNNT